MYSNYFSNSYKKYNYVCLAIAAVSIFIFVTSLSSIGNLGVGRYVEYLNYYSQYGDFSFKMFLMYADLFAVYIVSSLMVYKISKEYNIKYAWISWIPICNLFLYGKILSDHFCSFKNLQLWFPLLMLASNFFTSENVRVIGVILNYILIVLMMYEGSEFLDSLRQDKNYYFITCGLIFLFTLLVGPGSVIFLVEIFTLIYFYKFKYESPNSIPENQRNTYTNGSSNLNNISKTTTNSNVQTRVSNMGNYSRKNTQNRKFERDNNYRDPYYGIPVVDSLKGTIKQEGSQVKLPTPPSDNINLNQSNSPNINNQNSYSVGNQNTSQNPYSVGSQRINQNPYTVGNQNVNQGRKIVSNETSEQNNSDQSQNKFKVG